MSFSQSQSQSQFRHGTDVLDPVEKEKKVNELVHYMLVMDQKKVPIKKRDINRVVLKGQNRAFTAVMEEATATLHGVYGLKVVDLQDKLKDSFILVNDLQGSDSRRKCVVMSEKDSSEMGLLSVILGMIFMNGNVIHEDEMWHALKKLGIYQDEEHSTFGNVKKLIMKDFIGKGYLHTELNQSTDPPTRDFYWGQRAVHEISKRNMLSLVCDLNETQPNDWIHQMQQVEQQEQGGQDDEDVEVSQPGPSSSARS